MTIPTELLVLAKTHPTHKSLIDLAEAGYAYCLPCKQIRHLSDFRANARHKNGVQSRCKDCENVYNRERNKTPERKEYGAGRYARNRERYHHPDVHQKRLEYRKKYRQLHGRPKQQYRRKAANVIRGIYILQMEHAFKIGRSNNIHLRVADLRAALPHPSQLIHCIVVRGDTVIAESALHRQFAHCRLNGEWFTLTDTDIETLKSITEM